MSAAPTTGYVNEDFGYAQTYMANDILALQTLYGANFTTHSENTVYSWNATTGQEFINGVAQPAPGDGTGGSANRIFETVWDGNGIDTYDFSNYSTGVTVNLNPGASSITSAAQLAYLGDGHYAQGNIYNAYLFNGDARSYIDNAIGGSGNDIIVGNAIANTLNGGAGNDILTGGSGNDTIIGGAGTDTAVFSGNQANYLIAYNSNTQTYTVTDSAPARPTAPTRSPALKISSLPTASLQARLLPVRRPAIPPRKPPISTAMAIAICCLSITPVMALRSGTWLARK